ncbi:SCO6880 family protein [Nocardia sp. ncl2]|uniref:SCO6880 family protein n=1 Tax=Nocardia alni TaxID=2815723 RepID=UPI001C2145AF
MSAPQQQRRTYGGWSRPRSEGMYGLAWEATVLGFVFVVIAMITAVVVSFTAAVVVAAGEAIMWAPLAFRVNGRTGYERAMVMAQWLRTWKRKENLYRSGVFSKLGTAKLPGLLAVSQLYEGIDSGGYRFGLVHMPKQHLYTVLLRVWPAGSENVDQHTVDQWVAAWGGFVASLGGAEDIVAITPVLSTVPETGHRLAGEVAELTRPDAPELARAMMAELAATLPSHTVQLDAWCGITFRATTPERRRHPAEQAVEVGRRLPGIMAALAETGVRTRPMTSDEVTATVRRSYDPAAEADLETLATNGESHGLGWDDAGPISYLEHTGRLDHDGVVSTSWEMDDPPSGTVGERVLERLLQPTPDVPRKRVALVLRPHAAADAAHIVDDDYKNALVAGQSGKGVVSAHAMLRVGATEQAREEQARGHGVSRFGVLVTVTTAAGTDLPRIDALTKDLSRQARLRIRRSYYYQAAAFAASLGIGVLLPGMATLPRVMAA